MNFHENVKIVPVLTHGTGTADRNGEVIDTLGFDRCCVVVHFAAIASGAGVIKLQQSDTATDQTTLSSPSDVLGSSQAVGATDDNGAKYIDFRPTKRYVQLVVDKDGVNASDESAIAYLYQADETPVTHAGGTTAVGDGTGAVVGEFILNAVDGTA